jgi:hypothetical protein
MRRIFLSLIILAFLAACQQKTDPARTTPTATPGPILSPSPIPDLTESTNLPALTPTATPIPPAQNPHYTLSAVFDYGRRFVSVDQAITYTNNASETLHDFDLMVEPNQTPGAFRLVTFTWADGQPVRDFSMDNNLLHIQLPQPLNPYQQLELRLKFELTLPAIPPPADDKRPVPFGYTDHQTNLVDWYPYVPPYVAGKGWLAHKPWFYGEHQVYPMADFDVSIQLTNPPKDLLLAASAPAKQAGNSVSYSHHNARNFVLSASPYYKLFTQQVGEVTIQSYSFTYDVDAGKAALTYTTEALNLFAKLFSPYPHPTMTVVEADFLDGMEYDGLYFLSRGFYNLYGGTPQGYLAAIASHETAHQWWYARVGDDQALEPWLDEALATYSEYIFYKNLHPDYLKWWWDYRVDYYIPAGKINLQLYDYTSYRAYRDAVYLNGAHFLDDLRILIGDDAFYAFLQDYSIQFTGRIATASDFFNMLKKHTNKDYSGILPKYFK